MCSFDAYRFPLPDDDVLLKDADGNVITVDSDKEGVSDG